MLESYIIKNTCNFNRDRGKFEIDDITNEYLSKSSTFEKIKRKIDKLYPEDRSNQLTNKNRILS